MVLALLADRVDGMEKSNSEWEALCREILSTITLEANKEYFSVLDDTWHNKVDTWVSRFHELESAQQSVQRTGGTVPQPNKEPDIQEQIDDEIQDYLTRR